MKTKHTINLMAAALIGAVAFSAVSAKAEENVTESAQKQANTTKAFTTYTVTTEST